ncbi:MAG TPA: DUF3857 domain-containing protein [Candidatus Angelobacter sp.]|nr:DUF3857 domain-containing protein [Candidatus Angelobacter sp.]
MRSFCRSFFSLFLFLVPSVWAADVWSSPAFSESAEALRSAASAVKVSKDSEATILLNDDRLDLDREGRVVEVFHSIYRIENEDGVKGWSETSGRWSPWYQSRPEIRARVISPDGSVHTLDPKTLTEIAAQDSSPDTYTDDRRYGGPLPAIAVGAIVEEEVITRDTAPFFSGGQVERLALARAVPVNKTRVRLTHPESLPLRYFLQKMPNAKVKKSSAGGIETIEVEDGAYQAIEEVKYLPPDSIVEPEIEFSTGTSWSDVAASYLRVSEDKLRVSDVQPLLAKMNLKNASRAEAIRRLVTALHKMVRYTGVEFGESSLIPQFPAETLKRKYGDCKDKAAFLVTMLRAAGIPANLALLNAGPGQDINPDLPGMGIFDHAIVYVPAAGTEGEMWIDATAEYTEPGYLPLMDYGRWSLIIGRSASNENVSRLEKIPEVTPAQHLHLETREFTMANFGPAKIVETNQDIGSGEENLRDYYAGDPKKIRENGEGYVKDMYLADSLISVDHSDPTDMATPFKVSYVTKGRRGFTYLSNSNMAIRQETIFEGLPDYFYTKEDESKEGDGGSKGAVRKDGGQMGGDEMGEGKLEDRRKPRSHDWWIQPFATEWHYKILAPAGFKLRSLPVDKEQHLGPALYTQKYSSNPEGTSVEAVFRFESGQQRFTPSEGKALRDEIVKARKADPILVTFDEVGFSLLSAGKAREALSVEQQLVAQHPKDAMPRLRLADALLQAGMGERARSVAKEATLLDPKSAQAFSILGWTLQHDLIGRRLKKGFDYAGAVAAYRKAKQLDPSDKEIRSNLGYLLEFNPEGVRYGDGTDLEGAAVEFKELKKIDEQEGRRFEDNVLYDLWYARKFKEIIPYAESLPASDTRKSFILAAIGAQEGSAAALKKSLEITSDESERNKALLNAGSFLMRIQKYPEAGELMEASARGQAAASQLITLIGLLAKTQAGAEKNIDLGDPSGVFQELFVQVFIANGDWAAFEKRFVGKNIPVSSDSQRGARTVRQAMAGMRRQLEAAGLPMQVMADLFLSTAKYTKEGNDQQGYRVKLQFPGVENTDAFVSREDGQYRLIDLSAAGSRPENIGWEALARLDRNDLQGARQVLDWAREKVHISADDDPLSGQPFPHFWTKGQEGDADAIRTAALVLLPSIGLRAKQFAALAEARDHAANESQRNLLDMVLAFGYSAQQKWTDLLGVSERLTKSSPDSFIAYSLAVGAYAQLNRFDDWDKLLQDRLQKHPDDPQYVRSAALLALYRSDVAGSRKLLKSLADRGKATASDLNLYAWDALMLPGGVDKDSIEAAQRANDLTKNENFAILHTLACLYAESGRATQARDVLLKAMDAAKMDEPDSAVWFAYGKIAEQYGEIEAAQKMYARVEKSPLELPGSNYRLAQDRLMALKGGSTTAKAGQ